MKEDSNDLKGFEALKAELENVRDRQHVDFLVLCEDFVEKHPDLPAAARGLLLEEIVDRIKHCDHPPPKEFLSVMAEVPAKGLEELIADVPGSPSGSRLAVTRQLWQVVLLGEYERRRDEAENKGGTATRRFIVDRDVNELPLIRRWATRGYYFHPDPMEKGGWKEEITSEADVNFFERIANYSGGFDFERFLDQLSGELNRIPGRVRDTVRTVLGNLSKVRQLTRELPEITSRGSEGEERQEDSFEILPDPLIDRSAESAESRVLLERCFQKARNLDRRDQVIFEMTYQGSTQDEIAAKVGLTRSAVSKRRKAIFETIRSKVESNGKAGKAPDPTSQRSKSAPESPNSHFSEKGPIR